MRHVESVYNHAVGIMRRHPDVTAVSVAVGKYRGKTVMLACGTVLPDNFGRPITPRRLKRAVDRYDDESILVYAALRGCDAARFELTKMCPGGLDS